MRRLKYALAAGGLLIGLTAPMGLRADQTYTYTGMPYTACYGTDVCNGTTPALTITFTVNDEGEFLLNVGDDYADFTPFLTGFSITDGTGLSITNANVLPGDAVFLLATNAGGAIFAWAINVGSVNCSAGSSSWSNSSNFPPDLPTGDGSGCFTLGPPGGPFGNGNNMNDAGTWTMGTGTGTGTGGGTGTNAPEPSSTLLLGIGLLGLGIIQYRRRGKPYRTPAL
jgi:hypothetical protein